MDSPKFEAKIRKIVEDNVPKSIKHAGKTHYISRKKIDQVRDLERKEGGLLPLATLLPILFSGLGAAGGVASGVANAVKSVKEVSEQERHNKEMEKLAKESKPSTSGKGLTDIIKDFSKKTGLEKESRKLLKQVLNNLADAIDIKETKDGSGLYLSPYKAP